MKLSSSLQDLSISRKGLLLIAVPLVAQFMFLAGLILIHRANVQSQVRTIQALESIAEAQGVLGSLALTEVARSDFQVSGDPIFKSQFTRVAAKTSAALRRLEHTVQGGSELAAQVALLAPLIESYLDQQASAFQNSEQLIGKVEVTRIEGQQFEEISSKLHEVLDSTEALLHANELQLAQHEHWMNNWLLCVGVAGSLVTTLAGAATFDLAIGRRLRHLAKVAVRLAKGDQLTPAQHGQDEFAKVDLAFHQVAQHLAETREACDSRTRILQSVLTSMGDAVIVAGKDGELLLMNPAALRLFDTGAAADCSGLSTATPATTHQRTAIFPRAVLSRVLAGESIDEFDVLLPETNVRPAVWVTVTGRLLHDAQQNSCGAVLVARDISNRKSSEQAIRSAKVELENRVEERTRALAAVNRELANRSEENEAFVHTVSHDLRSPLVNLLGFSKELDLICDEVRTLVLDCSLPVETSARLEALLNEETPEALGYIHTAVERMSSIIDALLRLGRAGRVSYRSVEVDLDVTLHRVIAGLSITIHQRGANVTCGELPSVIGDPTALEQVFTNLIGNSLNYLDPQRPCEIEIGALPVDEMLDACGSEHSVTLYVKDNGLGIPRQSFGQIFRVFHRIHPGAAMGEGVGLALLKRIIDRHAGRIWFDSTEGVGTTFFVELLLANKPALEPALPV